MPNNVKPIPCYPDLTLDQYKAMASWCLNALHDNLDFLYDAKLFAEAVSSFCQELQLPCRASLESLIRNTHVGHVKRTSWKIKNAVHHHLERYVKGESILTIAKSIHYPPYLLAKMLLDELLDMNKLGRKEISKVMQDPETKLGHVAVIKEEYRASEDFRQIFEDGCNQSLTRLAREVRHVIEVDPMYGPVHDEARHQVGLEYEALLGKVLRAMDIPFETENDLRAKGTSRTPDVLLSTPVAIQVPEDQRTSPADDGWRVVCWIDSKALFGDQETHTTSVLPQAESYLHRFGPGLLLYWFGHAPNLARLKDIAVCAYNLPRKVLLPTNDFVQNPTYEYTEHVAPKGDR